MTIKEGMKSYLESIGLHGFKLLDQNVSKNSKPGHLCRKYGNKESIIWIYNGQYLGFFIGNSFARISEVEQWLNKRRAQKSCIHVKVGRYYTLVLEDGLEKSDLMKLMKEREEVVAI